MSISLKQILFIALGFIIIAAGFFCIKTTVVEASVEEGKKFDDWIVACVKDAKKKTCFLTQQVNITDKDNKTEVLAVYQLGYFNKDKSLQMVQSLPLGVDLVAGTSIISDKTLIAPAKYAICVNNWCKAIANISKEDLDKILSNANNVLGFIKEGKSINIPISNKGLKEGLEALK
jgi:invasion protein IalB